LRFPGRLLFVALKGTLRLVGRCSGLSGLLWRSFLKVLEGFEGAKVHAVGGFVSEDALFRTMLEIDVGPPPLPKEETRLEFMRQYAEDAGGRTAITGRPRIQVVSCGITLRLFTHTEP
jgi:hypothetical protein